MGNGPARRSEWVGGSEILVVAPVQDDFEYLEVSKLVVDGGRPETLRERLLLDLQQARWLADELLEALNLHGQ